MRFPLRWIPNVFAVISGMLTSVALFGAWTPVHLFPAPACLGCPSGQQVQTGVAQVADFNKVDGFPVILLGFALGLCLSSVVVTLTRYRNARMRLIEFAGVGGTLVVVTFPLPIWPGCWGNGCSVPDILQNPACNSFGQCGDAPPTILNHILLTTPPGAFLAAGIAALITAIAFAFMPRNWLSAIPFAVGNVAAGVLIAIAAIPALTPPTWAIGSEQQGAYGVGWAVYVALAAMAFAFLAASSSFLVRRPNDRRLAL
jgi:hypothetical protein